MLGPICKFSYSNTLAVVTDKRVAVLVDPGTRKHELI